MSEPKIRIASEHTEFVIDEVMTRALYDVLKEQFEASDGSGRDPGDEMPDNPKPVDNRIEYRGKLYKPHAAEFLQKFDAEFDERDPDVQRDEIGGLDQVLDRLEAFRIGIEHSNLYQFMGVSPPNGFILTGPPGYGKTHIAKYMAHNLGARFVDLPLNQYESKWVGEAEKTLGNKLEMMLRYNRVTGQKVLLFMDEAEEALKDRRLEGWHGPRVNLLLRYMDGLGENKGVIYGAATNHVDKVDPAFLRAGRLDFIIDIKEYDAAAMGDVVRATTVRFNRRAPYHDPFQLYADDWNALGAKAKSHGLNPADMNEVFRLAAEKKIRGMVAADKPALVATDYTITRPDLEEVIGTYKRQGEKRIGFA